MQLEKLGSEISSLRKELGISQKLLCEDICTQPTISLIERGEMLPGLDIIYKISLKLKKPLSYFLNIMFENNYEYVHEMIVYIEEQSLSQRFDIVYEMVAKELEQVSEKNNPWFYHFLQWQHTLCLFYLKKINSTATTIKLKALLARESNLILSKDFLRERILNSLAFIYALEKNYDLSIYYYEKIDFTETYSSSPRLDPKIYRLRVLYNKAKTLYDMKRYSEATQVIDEGIETSLKLENMSLLGNFYYYKGQCCEKTEESFDEASFCYKQALFFFSLLKRELYTDLVKKQKGRFLV